MKIGFGGHYCRRNGGSTLIEFAFVLPVLLLIVFAICQYGFIFAAYTTVRNASALAARYATLSNPKPTKLEVEAVAKQALTPMLDSSKATAVANLDSTVGSLPGAKSVQVNYDLTLVLPFVVPGKTSGSILTLSATTVMR